MKVRRLPSTVCNEHRVWSRVKHTLGELFLGAQERDDQSPGFSYNIKSNNNGRETFQPPDPNV